MDDPLEWTMKEVKWSIAKVYPMAVFDTKLLEFIVCPLTKEPLIYDKERQELVSIKAKLAYPIKDGIPILLADEARSLSEDT